MNNHHDNENPLRILHIEDSPPDAEIIRERLIDAGFSFHLDWADDEQEFTSFLHGGRYDIILADYQIPGFNAPAAYQLAKTVCPDVPFICVSGAVGEDRAVELIRQGATDYVQKDRLDRLPLAIQRALDEADERKARIQAEDALREQEEKYRNLFNNAEVGIFRSRFDGSEVLEVNRKFLEIVGMTREEVCGKPSVNLWANPEERNEMKTRLIAGESISNFEYKMLNKQQGDIRNCLTSLRLYREQGILEGSVVDITEYRRASLYRKISGEVLSILNDSNVLQDSIQRVLAVLKTRTGLDAVGIRLQKGDDFPYYVQEGFSRDFLLKENTLSERSVDGGVCLDKNGNINLECTCGLVITGKTDPSSPLFTPGGSFWTNDSFPLLDIPPDQDPRRHPRNRCIHEGYASVALIPIRNQNTIVGLLQFNDRRKGCFTLNMVEILEGIALHIGAALMRKRIEEQIHELNRDFISFLENTTDFIYFKDNKGCFGFCSQTVADITGHASWRDMIGKRNRDIFPEDMALMYNAQDDSVLSTGKPLLNEENLYCDASGEKKWVSTSKWPLLNAEGKIEGLFGISRDITKQKRLEGEILHINRTLEIRVEQEVQKNMEQERIMIHQSRMAAMGEMLGNIAHQWRQPLSSLGILLYNIKDACQYNELDVAYMDKAFADGNRIIQSMSSTITDFHSFFSTDNAVCVFSVREQIEKAIALVESEFLRSQISIRMDAPEDLKMSSFPNRFSQVLLNLLSNAKEAILKHQPPIPGKVEIVAAEQDGRGCVWVRDTGGGIPEDIRGRIFDPYFSTKERGSGIGLYMSKMIIERHMSGSITARNIEGGAELRICVPLAKDGSCHLS